jgi:hypothetical protein
VGNGSKEAVVLHRRILVGAIGVVAVMVSAASLAWACVPDTSMALSSNVGPPGTTVTATLSGFPRGDTVEIRLGSESGPMLARQAPRAADGPFTVSFAIPAGTPQGCHVVGAIMVGPNHAGHGWAPAAFKVTTESNADPSCAGAPTTDPPATNPPSTNRPSTTPPASGGAIRTPVSAIVPQSGGKTINGTSRSETLRGTAFADVINCGAGNDRVSGGGGNDVINCGAGRDSVNGGAGNDRIGGGSGNDKLSGGAGSDRVSGGSGKDKLAGGSGSDRLLGGPGNDTLRGNAGKDRLFGNAGADLLFRSGSDRLFGGSGRNRIIG